MSNFFWPEPSLEFAVGVIDPGSDSDSRYFICHRGKILVDLNEDRRWQPVAESILAEFLVIEQHFMGHLGTASCYAVEVEDALDREFSDVRGRLEEFDTVMFNLVGRALQINDWHRSHQYCGNCGKKTTDHPQDRARVCDSCGLRFYPRLSPSIIVLVHREDEVLLGRNRLFPPELFSTLAGFVEPGESIEETVRREVKEEVGVDVGELSYRGSQPWPFPNSLMLGFHAAYESGDIVIQEDELDEAKWFHLSHLPRIPGKHAISRWLIDEYLSERGYPV